MAPNDKEKADLSSRVESWGGSRSSAAQPPLNTHYSISEPGPVPTAASDCLNTAICTMSCTGSRFVFLLDSVPRLLFSLLPSKVYPIESLPLKSKVFFCTKFLLAYSAAQWWQNVRRREVETKPRCQMCRDSPAPAEERRRQAAGGQFECRYVSV